MEELTEGSVMVIEAYAALDPNKYTEIYDDRLLKKYVTALIKRQWGANMAKFDGVQLPGGITTRGTAIQQEAMQEIEVIENEIRLTHELPSDFFIG
jgi:hypothetical protein